MDVNELIERSKRKDNTNEEWLQLQQDMDDYLDSDADAKDKRKLGPLGPIERVFMICDGIKRGLL